MKHGQFTIDMLNVDVHVLVGGKQQQVMQRCAKILGSEIDEIDLSGHDGFAAVHGRTAVIWLDETSDIGIITHEAYHAVHRIMKYIGLENKGEEWSAHLMGYVCKQTVNILEQSEDTK